MTFGKPVVDACQLLEELLLITPSDNGSAVRIILYVKSNSSLAVGISHDGGVCMASFQLDLEDLDMLCSVGIRGATAGGERDCEGQPVATR